MGGPKKVAKKASGARITSGALLLATEQARALLSKSWSDVTDQERLRVLNASEDAKPVAVARNPNYLADLVPPEGGFRHTGVWQKKIDSVIDVEGLEPAAQRDIHTTPAGLANLGNTCYVNSALQVLFTNRLFRNSVLRLDDGVVQADGKGILKELRELFLSMSFGETTSISPRGFMKVLKLQAGEQQDAQEFQKLLMQELEKSMSRSQDDKVS